MTPSQRRWFGAAALALAVPTGWVWWRLAQGSDDNLNEFHGARLGMTASQLRQSFALADEGAFRAAGNAGSEGELWLEWTPTQAASLAGARFEFHEGLLVAIRAELHDASEATRVAAEPVQLTEGTLRHRALLTPDSARVRISILSRDCPTHAEEVRRLIGLL